MTSIWTRFPRQNYASQTKILENETAVRACLFDGLCEGSLPKSSTHTLEKCLEKTRPTCCFVFQNLRLGSIKMFAPMGEIVQQMGRSGTRLSQSPSKTHARHAVPFSQIFVWEQPSATSALFFDNLHFGQSAKSVNLDWWLTLLAP